MLVELIKAMSISFVIVVGTLLAASIVMAFFQRGG